MRRRNLLQMLASLPFLHFLSPYELSCIHCPAWQFTPLLGSEYRYAENGHTQCTACTLYVSIKATHARVQAFAHAYDTTRGVRRVWCGPDSAACDPPACFEADADKAGYAVIDITAHKKAFLHACKQCSVPPEAIAGVVTSFTMLERREAM